MCSFKLLRLDCFSSSSISCAQFTCNQNKRHQVVVVLVADLVSHLIEEKDDRISACHGIGFQKDQAYSDGSGTEKCGITGKI